MPATRTAFLEDSAEKSELGEMGQEVRVFTGSSRENAKTL